MDDQFGLPLSMQDPWYIDPNNRVIPMGKGDGSGYRPGKLRTNPNMGTVNEFGLPVTPAGNEFGIPTPASADTPMYGGYGIPVTPGPYIPDEHQGQAADLSRAFDNAREIQERTMARYGLPALSNYERDWALERARSMAQQTNNNSRADMAARIRESDRAYQAAQNRSQNPALSRSQNQGYNTGGGSPTGNPRYNTGGGTPTGNPRYNPNSGTSGNGPYGNPRYNNPNSGTSGNGAPNGTINQRNPAQSNPTQGNPTATPRQTTMGNIMQNLPLLLGRRGYEELLQNGVIKFFRDAFGNTTAQPGPNFDEWASRNLVTTRDNDVAVIDENGEARIINPYNDPSRMFDTVDPNDYNNPATAYNDPSWRNQGGYGGNDNGYGGGYGNDDYWNQPEYNNFNDPVWNVNPPPSPPPPPDYGGDSYGYYDDGGGFYG